MERSVEVLAIILFGVLGLSHIVQPKAWVELAAANQLAADIVQYNRQK